MLSFCVSGTVAPAIHIVCFQFWQKQTVNALFAGRQKRKPDTALDTSLQFLTKYFNRRSEEQSDNDDGVFGRMVGLEVATITNEVIKTDVKRKVLDIVFSGVQEQMKHQQEQTTGSVQYFVVREDGSLQSVQLGRES